MNRLYLSIVCLFAVLKFSINTCPAQTKESTTNSPRLPCDPNEFTLECNQRYCTEPNSECQYVQDEDHPFCGCVFCNYDVEQKQCVGLCKHRDLTKCVPRSLQPENDGCGCATCGTSYDELGNAICSGDCLGGPYVCKPLLMYLAAYGLYNYRCICQEPSTPDPPPNQCVNMFINNLIKTIKQLID